jgi:hypothetical protein
MSGGDLDYALARIAAHRAGRAGAPAWQAVGAARGLGATLAALRQHGLASWISEIDPDADPRRIERALRQCWRGKLDTLAGWLPTRWHPVLALCRAWIDLPARRTAAPNPTDDCGHAAAARDTIAVYADWQAALLQRFETAGAGDDPGLLRLGRMLATHRRTFASLPAGNGWPARAEIERALLTFMHITPPGVATAFAWIALLALEHERVRGLLLAATLEERAA